MKKDKILNPNKFEFHYNLNYKNDKDIWCIGLTNNKPSNNLEKLKSTKFQTYSEALKEYEYLINKKKFNKKILEDNEPKILSIWVEG